jgi:DNA-binding MarR family transcriptional regulator
MSAKPLTDAVFASFRALGTEIDRLDQAAADSFGLIRTDMRALDIISSSGPLTPTALARSLGFTTGGVTSVLDRLERAGYVRRWIDPDDRRRQLIEATDTAAARGREVFGRLIRATRRLLGSYTEDQLRTIQDFLDHTGELTGAYANSLIDQKDSPAAKALEPTARAATAKRRPPTTRRAVLPPR